MRSKVKESPFTVIPLKIILESGIFLLAKISLGTSMSTFRTVQSFTVTSRRDMALGITAFTPGKCMPGATDRTKHNDRLWCQNWKIRPQSVALSARELPDARE
ncbi:UNVERIFIED_CONTAM: hypothetical protein Sindi_2386300 [Sesamum indicum]